MMHLRYERGSVILAVSVWVLCGFAACASVQSTQPAAESQMASSPRAADDIAAPPGIKADLIEPHTGDPLERAKMIYAHVVASLDKPKYVRIADPETQRPVVEVSEPPLAAQHAFLRGRLAMADGRQFEATRHFESARRLAPNEPELHRLLAKSNPVKAQFHLQRALVLDPTDLASAYELGRQMLEFRRWDDAINAFAHAQSMRDEANDTEPARWPLINFYLGTCLKSAGYDAAAIECWVRFLEAPARRGLGFTLAYQLAVAKRQRGIIWQAVGDAHHRLNQPELALEDYQHAAETGVTSGDALVARIAYTLLRLQQPDAARSVVLAHFDRLGGDQQQISLVTYLTRHGLDAKALAEQLMPLYEKQDRPAHMALLLAQLQGPKRGAALLREHLTASPTDRPVLEALIDLELSCDASLTDVLQRTAAAVDAVAAHPDLAERFTLSLVERVDDIEIIHAAIDTLAPALRNRSAVLYIEAIGRIEAGQATEARAVLERAISVEQPLGAARVALARLLLEADEHDRANQVLEPLRGQQLESVTSLQAQVLARSGDVDQAIQLLDEAIECEDDDVELIVTKAQLQRVRKSDMVAERTLLDALTARTDAEPLYVALFEIYDDMTSSVPNRAKQRVKLMWRMLRAIPHSRVARLKGAEWDMVNKNYETAERSLRSLLEDDPADYEALDAMLELLVLTDRKEESEKLLDQALADAPNHRPLRRIAMTHLIGRLDKPAKAEDILRQVVAEEPDNLEALNHLLELLVLTDRRPESIDLIDARLAKAPNDQKLLAIAVSHFIHRLENNERGDPLYERLLRLRPTGPDRDVSLALLYLRQSRHDQALDIMVAAIERGDPIEPPGPAISPMDVIQHALKQTEDSVELDRRAASLIKRLPQHEADLWFYWAWLYESRDNHDRSERMMLELLEKHPDHAQTNNSLGYVWAYRNKNLERARELIERAVNAVPDQAAYLDSLGWVHYKLGDFDKAVAWLKRAKAANQQNDSIILDHVGDALYRTGKKTEAIKYWRLAKRNLRVDGEITDPERLSLPKRLAQKIKAAQTNSEPQLAEVPHKAPDGEAAPTP